MYGETVIDVIRTINKIVLIFLCVAKRDGLLPIKQTLVLLNFYANALVSTTPYKEYVMRWQIVPL